MRFARQPPERRQFLLLLLGEVIAGLCAGAIVGALVLDRDEEASADPRSRLATVSQIATQPTRYFGRSVSLSSEVAEVLGPRALLVGGSEFEGGDSLLVVGAEPFAVPGARELERAVLETDLIQAVGTLRVFDKEELEERLGLSLADRLERFSGDPVLVVDEVAVTPRLLSPADPTTTARILSLPRAFLGELVSVRGRVTDVIRGEALVLDGGLLVLAAALKADSVQEGDIVDVRGTVRRLDPDQRPGRGDLDEALFGELLTAPAIAARSIDLAPPAPPGGD